MPINPDNSQFSSKWHISMKKTQWAWHFSGELSDCLKRFMIQQFDLQALLSFILAILLLGLPAWNQLHAAKLVLIVEDENAKPVPGMEVIHTDKNGDKAKGTYDAKAGVYRFGDLVDGAGSVTAFKRNYRLAGVRWFLHTPDTVHIVSVKGGHLWYKESDRNIWFKTSNRLLQIGYTYAETETPNAEEIISNAGFVRTKKRIVQAQTLEKDTPILNT